MSSKLFIAALEEVFKELEWEKKVISINGQKLNHLYHTDDVVLIPDNFDDIQEMITKLLNN